MHDGHRREDRDRGLADGKKVQVRPELVAHVDHVVDIVVEVEGALGQRHRARIGPVRDVDLVMGKHCLHRAAQQRRVMARKRRDDEQLLLRRHALHRGGLALEMDEVAERAFPDDPFGHGNGLAVHLRLVEAELRFAVAPGRRLENVDGGRQRLVRHAFGEGIERVAQRPEAHFRRRPERCDRGMIEFVEMIQHALPRFGRSPGPVASDALSSPAPHVAAQHEM